MKRVLKYALLGLVLAGLGNSAKAVLLSDLIDNNGTLTVGDKTFADFGFEGPIAATEFNITPLTTGLPGIRIGGPFSAAPEQARDWQLTYTVTASGGQLISDIHQYVNATGSEGTFVTVSEHAKNAAGDVVAYSTVGHDFWLEPDFSDPTAELNDKLILDQPLEKVWIVKDILLNAEFSRGSVAATIIEQRFSQVPEPTTLIAGAMLLLPFGASTLRLLRRKNTA